jgi:hypothetical protein
LLKKKIVIIAKAKIKLTIKICHNLRCILLIDIARITTKERLLNMKNTFTIKRATEEIKLDYIYQARRYMKIIQNLMDKTKNIEKNQYDKEGGNNDTRTICRYGCC